LRLPGAPLAHPCPGSRGHRRRPDRAPGDRRRHPSDAREPVCLLRRGGHAGQHPGGDARGIGVMMKLPLGVAGLRFGGAWARIYAAHPDVALAALCDLEEERARALAAELGVPCVARSFEELLAADVEAVHLVTPAPLHADQAIAALRAGKHVLCAVPAAM